MPKETWRPIILKRFGVNVMKKSVCKVLFIGNSYTYYNNMTYMLKYLSKQWN